MQKNHEVRPRGFSKKVVDKKHCVWYYLHRLEKAMPKTAGAQKA